MSSHRKTVPNPPAPRTRSSRYGTGRKAETVGRPARPAGQGIPGGLEIAGLACIPVHLELGLRFGLPVRCGSGLFSRRPVGRQCVDEQSAGIQPISEGGPIGSFKHFGGELPEAIPEAAEPSEFPIAGHTDPEGGIG